MLHVGTVQNELPGMFRRPIPATHDGLTVAFRNEPLLRELGMRVNRMFVPNLNACVPFSHDTSSTKFCVGTCRDVVNVIGSKLSRKRKLT